MRSGETKQLGDGSVKVGKHDRDGFVELATNGGIPKRFPVHGEVVDTIELLAGDRLAPVPPSDPDREAAESVVWAGHGLPSIFAVNGDIAIARVAAALRTVREAGHAKGLAEGVAAGRANVIGKLRQRCHSEHEDRGNRNYLTAVADSLAEELLG